MRRGILTRQAALLTGVLLLIVSGLRGEVKADGLIYHVCDCGQGAASRCISGDDTVPVTSPQRPWRSFTMARQMFPKLAPGDTIAFCQGGSFVADGGSWLNSSCTAGAPCVITDYRSAWGQGTEGRPLIITPRDKTAFSFANNGLARHREGYIISNLELRGTGASGVGFFFYNDIDDVILEHLDITGFDLGVHVAGSNPPGVGSDGSNERITLKNSRVADNAGQGWLGSCDGCAILNNVFDNNGFKGGIFYHNIYWDGSAQSTDGRIVGNTLTRSALVDRKCQGVSLVVHGSHRNLLIADNSVSEAIGAAAETCWGIAVDTAYAKTEGFYNLVIRGNSIRDVGSVGIGINACVDCRVEGNKVSLGQPFSATAIAVPDRQRGVEDLPMTRVSVRDNSISFTNSAVQTAIILGGEGSGHVSAGNVITYAGISPEWSCFNYPLPLASYRIIDTNSCSFPQSPSGHWEKSHGPLTNWRAYSGFDGNSMQTDTGNDQGAQVGGQVKHELFQFQPATLIRQ